MIADLSVFDAVRRGYDELGLSSNEEIVAYFAEVDAASVAGHVSNVKGILFEETYAADLVAQGIEATLFDATNHPLSDIAIYEGGNIVAELQLKATDSVSYVMATLEANPDISVVVTSEVATHFSSDLVIDSGIHNAALEETVSSALFESVSPVSGFSFGLGLLFGLPF